MKTMNLGPKQEFKLNAPGARQVWLVGSFTQWQQRPIPMRPAPGGEWQAVVGLNPGTYYYRFVVDGEWWDDPECPLHVSNPFGSQDAVRVIA